MFEQGQEEMDGDFFEQKVALLKDAGARSLRMSLSHMLHRETSFRYQVWYSNLLFAKAQLSAHISKKPTSVSNTGSANSHPAVQHGRAVKDTGSEEVVPT